MPAPERDPLRLPGSVAAGLVLGLYLTALALLVQGVAHGLVMGGTEAPVGSIRWRFGFIGSVFSHLPYPLLGLAVASLTAVFAARRRLVVLVGATQLALTVAALAAFAIFLLDATQIGAVVPPELRGKYTLTLAQTAFNAILACALLTWLAVATLRAARDLGARREPRSPATDGLVVGAPGRVKP